MRQCSIEKRPERLTSGSRFALCLAFDGWDIVEIPKAGAGTEGEGQILTRWCHQHEFRSVVFVVARDHSRRIRRVVDRVITGHATRVTVQPARYSSFDPDRWWETRDRAGLVRDEGTAELM